MKWISSNFSCYIIAWPPNSADLSPIEHCWGNMKRNIDVEEKSNYQTFKAAIEREWINLDQDAIDRDIQSHY